MPPDAPPPPKPRRPRLARGQKVYVARGPLPVLEGRVRCCQGARVLVALGDAAGECWSFCRRRVFTCREDALNYRGP